jgi:hypothetical protein
MAFVKYDSKTQSTTLVVADLGGQNEKVLATRQAPSFFYTALFSNAPPTRPSWSADGRWIAVAGINTSPERPRDNGELFEVDAASGAERAVRRVDGSLRSLRTLTTIALWSALPISSRRRRDSGGCTHARGLTCR